LTPHAVSDINAVHSPQQEIDFMPLTSGTRLEHYEILTILGSGGMGEVYRARDTKLGRDVAFKVLPSAFAGDADRLTRFQREAHALAALNHPNIAQIYGLAESNGTRGIVMELVEGETLQARLKRGPVPVKETIEIAKQIAEALEAAHERGILHRDLKPGNIMLTAEGRVKVLDFGLAKSVESHDLNTNLSQSPTVVTNAPTEANVLLGTAAYLSPEQVRGRPADHRSDIWAFGIVLYEMLTGQQAFTGETMTDVISGIVRIDPDWNGLPREVPASLRAVLKRCLEKDRRRRFQAIGDVRYELEEAKAAPVQADSVKSNKREWVAWGVAALLLVGFISIFFLMRTPPAFQPPASRFYIEFPPEATLSVSPDPYPAVSPDGRYVVFRAGAAGASQLWLRPIGALTVQPIPGDTVVSLGHPFWSPDSRYIAFFSQNKLKKVAVEGGPSQVLCNADGQGGTWGAGNVILFENSDGLFRVPAAGGNAVPVRIPEKSKKELAYHYPSFLPDGQHFVYVAVSADPGRTEVRAGALDSKDDKPLFFADSPVFYSYSRHLLFVRDGTLMAQPFDPEKLSLTGDVFPVAERIAGTTAARNGTGDWAFSLSNAGTLVYRTGAEGGSTNFTWVDRSGKDLGSLPIVGNFVRPAISRDQNRIVAEKVDAKGIDLWVLDLLRGSTSRFTYDPAPDMFAVFSPDGQKIAFTSNRSGGFGIYIKAATGVGIEELIQNVAGTTSLGVASWSPAGNVLLYNVLTGDAGWDAWALPLTGDRKPYPVFNQKFDELRTRFSPDGHWIVYTSNETGRQEIYVQTFPVSGGKWQVSVNGGIEALWRGDGKEIFFNSLDGKMMAVDVKLSSTFEAGVPHELFQIPGAIAGTRFVVASDGQRFLLPLTAKATERPRLTAVLNWTSDIKK
jgi:serine/threonine protein kinase/Tol biopolymer transport system component